ncbi:hypothetical protein AB0M46_47175 [Dactylosporangium sp. NPDC051485]|uniref:hypothetical protein n=1 Tax=Dactylosporangium sp. NPDC051485 TaxID=3154846 RepID=UPI00342E9648
MLTWLRWPEEIAAGLGVELAGGGRTTYTAVLHLRLPGAHLTRPRSLTVGLALITGHGSQTFTAMTEVSK